MLLLCSPIQRVTRLGHSQWNKKFQNLEKLWWQRGTTAGRNDLVVVVVVLLVVMLFLEKNELLLRRNDIAAVVYRNTHLKVPRGSISYDPEVSTH